MLLTCAALMMLAQASPAQTLTLQTAKPTLSQAKKATHFRQGEPGRLTNKPVVAALRSKPGMSVKEAPTALTSNLLTLSDPKLGMDDNGINGMNPGDRCYYASIFSADLMKRFAGNTMGTFQTILPQGITSAQLLIIDANTMQTLWSTTLSSPQTGTVISVPCDYQITGDAILIYEACNVRVLRAIRPYLPQGVPCYIYYCNPVSTTFRHPAEELQAIRALGYRLTSFDPCEAERYGMECTGQYFRYPARRTDEISSDCFFCGLPKDRAGLLHDLRTRLESEGMRCDFVIPRTPSEKLTYPRYLDRLARTRCVIDICQGGQTGLTRRPLEALFYDKKLLTNNPQIAGPYFLTFLLRRFLSERKRS